MDYNVKKLPKSQVEITVTVPEEKMHDFRKKACEDISKEVKVKGFRPGHVPPHVLEQYVEKKYIDAHTQEVAIQRTYSEIVVKEKIPVVSRPKVKIEKDEPLTYVATVATLPEVEIKDYKSIKVPEKEIKVAKSDVDKVLEDMKAYATTYKDTDRAAKKDDRVELDFEGFDEKGKSIPNTKSENHPIIIGKKTMVPGFEEQLIGLKKGEKKEFKVKFPKDYAKKDFQNKEMKFKVKINKVEEPAEPKIDEAFVEKLTGKKMSVKELEADIERNIKAKKQQESKQDRENKYIEELLKKTKVEIPEALVDEEVSFILEDMQNTIAQRGMEFEKFLEQAKTSLDALRKKYRPEGERRIKVRLALQYLIKEEKIEIDDKEIKGELEKIKANYPPAEHEKIDKEFESGHLKAQLRNKIALDKLFEKVLS